MNQIGHIAPDSEVVARAREIVARHKRPDFINEFDVKLGFMDDEPVIYVLYRTEGNEDEMFSQEWERRAQEYRELDDAVLPELSDALNRFALSYLIPEQHWDSFPY